MKTFLKNIGFSPYHLSHIILACISFQLLIMISLSYPLFSNIGRHFYTVPLLPFEAHSLLNILLFSISCISLLLINITDKKKEFIIIFFISIFCSIVFDIHRLQIWLYQGVLILAAYIFCQEENRIKAWRWIFIATYFWAGINKLNYGFFDIIFPWLMGGIGLEETIGSQLKFAILPGIFEAFIGLLLIFKATRKIAVIFSFLFHIVILIILISLQWNHQVYIWNIISPILLYLLFWKNSEGNLIPQGFYNYCIILFCMILPATNPFGILPNNLSFKMYSGDYKLAYFIDYHWVNDKPIIDEKISIGKWANKDMNQASIFTHPWVFKQMAKKRCKNQSHLIEKSYREDVEIHQGLLFGGYKYRLDSNRKKWHEYWFCEGNKMVPWKGNQ